LGSGESINIRYIRDGKTRSVKATLGEQKIAQSSGTEIHPGLAGATFASSTVSSSGGIEVTEVTDGSPAAQRGLRAGDVITAVNRRAVRNLQQLTELATGNRILFLLVKRGDRNLMLQIR
jgi:S1-C subfamily serine protease